MLDEFSLEAMREAVALNAAREKAVEARSVRRHHHRHHSRRSRETGVDFISVGGITKHVRAVDLSMRFEFQA